MLTRKMAILTIVILLCTAFVFTLRFLVFTPEQAIKIKPKIIIVSKTSDPNVEFWQTLAAGSKVAAKEFGAEVEILAPRLENDVDSQIKMVDTILKYGPLPKAIILAPIDAEKMTPLAEKIKKAGVQLITIEAMLKGNLASSVIVTDHVVEGKKAGEEAKRLLPSRSRVFIINDDKSSPVQMEREKGVREALAVYPSIQIMDTHYINGENEAYEFTQQHLSGSDSIDGIITLSEAGTKGAAQAVKKLGFPGKVKLVCFSSSIEEIDQLEKGEIQSIVVQKPFNMGYLGVKTSVQLLNGEKINPQIDTGSEVVTRDNMYDYEIEKLLFPFGER
ncbi:substrate-binding domain-containing protein [Paenibacillus sp. LMG 31460]|uniref:Substrate-binding domain-containing protein n=1 Tax=Paenibacillus germinis TaxID=2654979 RepID=A0ABX1Z9Y2_9BACL|nr:substrate-binding domain-containing protein [Paenibacillus germinis]NOU88726.1 substrate-binding domain-containing protein [Paenibacillus germinis]